MKRKNFYSSEIANRTEIVKLGFKELVEAAQLSRNRKAWLVCNAKSNLEGFISDLVGEKTVATLQKGQAVDLPKNCSMVFYHAQAIPQSADGSPILVCYPDQKLLQRVDGVLDVSCLIVLPWSMDDIRPWILAHGAVDILGKVNASPSVIANQVVQTALEELFAIINVSTGVIHPSDKDSAIGTFKVLRDAGEEYDPGQVEAWFVQKGMAPKHASDIAEIATNPGRFRRSRGSQSWGEAELQRWRSKAKIS